MTRPRRVTLWAALMADGRELDGREKCRVLITKDGESVTIDVKRPLVFMATGENIEPTIKFFTGMTTQDWLVEIDREGQVIAYQPEE